MDQSMGSCSTLLCYSGAGMVTPAARPTNSPSPHDVRVQPRVLVLAPSARAAAAIGRFLTARGFATTLAASADRAHVEAHPGRFDLLLVDAPEGPGRASWDWEPIARAVQAPVVLLRPTAGGTARSSHGQTITALRKPVAWDTVVRVMARVLNGHEHSTDAVGPRAAPAPWPAQSLAADAKPLSPREQEVLRMLVDGVRNKAVADRLHLSEPTVKKHVQRIVSKLGARDRTHAAAIAVRAGLVD